MVSIGRAILASFRNTTLCSSSSQLSFFSDPNTTLIKLRQFGEAIAQDIASRSSIAFDENTSQSDLLYRLNNKIQLSPSIRTLFHTLRIEGNTATHQFVSKHKEASDGLKVARELAVWFHRSFGNQGANFNAGVFIKIEDPSKNLNELQLTIKHLKSELSQAKQLAENSQQLAELEAKEKEETLKLAEVIDEEAQTLKEQAELNETKLLEQQKKFEAHIQKLQAEIKQQKENKDKDKEAKDTKQLQKIVHNTIKATEKYSPNEELTRIIIDLQLQEAGWEADTELLRYSKGERPEKGKNKAIAEWPTKGKNGKGRADYVLFMGLTPIAVVEAKRENANVAGKISQAERYASGFSVTTVMQPAWEVENRTIPWADEAEGLIISPLFTPVMVAPILNSLKNNLAHGLEILANPVILLRLYNNFIAPLV